MIKLKGFHCRWALKKPMRLKVNKVGNHTEI